MTRGDRIDVIFCRLAAVFVVLAILLAILSAVNTNAQQDCTGYKNDPIYRPGQYGVMIREDRYTCVEWGTR